MNTEVVNAYRAKMVVGNLYKNMLVDFIEINNNGILVKITLNEIITEKNTIGLFKYESYCKTCTEWVQPKGHFPMRKYAKLLTESERLQDELEPIYD